MKDLKELVKDVERDFLAGLLVSLKHGKLSKEEVKKVASEFVSQTYETHEDLFNKLYVLSDKSKEARRVFVKYAPEYHEEKDALALSHLRVYSFKLVNEEVDKHGR